ncbi:MAG: phospho-N-acetylmuramoyl-pentapeptide-transferase [Faecalibacterium sp.]|jgi:phospho-N-acetylmuramoyl-pentapeptide-transferase|nr:phospho-N-acetylmuramoyl-pentapeptide-transferase [Faecalibacterium sp.]
MARYALMIAALVGFLVTAGVAVLLLPILQKIRFAQPAKRLTGPEWHKQKAGTPTLGGLAFLVGSVCAAGAACFGLNFLDAKLLNTHQKMNLVLAVACAMAFAAIGFTEDCLKVVLHRRRGLHAWQRLLLEAVVTTFLLLGLHYNGALETGMVVPFVGYFDFGIAYYPLAYALILALVNCVHLTDGIDGLCASVSFVVMLGFLVICGLLNAFQLSLFAAGLAGALVAFLLWNFYPAKLFMGDTGSLFLGGAIVSIAFCMGWPSLLMLLGAAFLLEGLTVVLQLGWHKLSHGKLLFKMAPLHAELELKGWSETRITAAFAALAAAMTLLALLFAYVS